MKFRRGLAISIAVHLAVLILLVLGSGGSGEKKEDGGNGDPEKNTKIVPKKSDGEIVEEIEITITELPKKEKKKEGKDCVGDQWFGGIGVIHSFGSHILTEVPEGYPAYEAGIRVGDTILSEVDDIRGEVGTEVTVAIERNGQLLYFTIVRGKICIEEVTKDTP